MRLKSHFIKLVGRRDYPGQSLTPILNALGNESAKLTKTADLTSNYRETFQKTPSCIYMCKKVFIKTKGTSHFCAKSIMNECKLKMSTHIFP